jgi:NTP pyrophosphatase (non-canonical NTP hydrolase)
VSNYRDFVDSTLQDGCTLELVALGLASEAGEYCQVVRRTHEGKQFDRKAALLELGDIMWYLQAACIDLGTSLEEIQQLNMYKPTKRRAKKNET